MANNPSIKVKYPNSLFNTWLEYRYSKGQLQSAVINEINAKLGKKYSNSTVYSWKKSPDDYVLVFKKLYESFIYPELAEVIRFSLNNNDASLDNEVIDFLVSLIIKPSGQENLSKIFNLMDLNIQEKTIKQLSSDLKM